LIAVLAAPAWANNPPPDEEKDERRGGNAIDNAGEKAATPTIQPPGYYEVMGDFWAQFLARGVDAAAGSMFWGTSPEDLPATSSADLYILPIDGPAESILDQMDESQANLVLVGMPGSAQESGGAAGAITGTQSAPAPSPPPEASILDQIEAMPAPSSPPVNPDSAKPAANQAKAPQIVEAKGK
jgi:hypothetical protein